MLKDLRIQKKLLEYYTENYAKMPNTRDEAIEFLSRKNMHMGLCASSYFVFSQRISRRKWLKRECKYGNLWYSLLHFLTASKFSDSHCLFLLY